MTGPLAGIRVVDFTRVLAGPHCAKLLQDLGAKVIKIEPPSPDFTRLSEPCSDGMSGYYAQQNAGKRAICLDLHVPAAADVARRLCERADVVVENFRAGALRPFGLDYESLSTSNPRIIYGSITGFGQTGSWSHRPAYAATIHAETGLTSASAEHYGDALDGWHTDSACHGDVYPGIHAALGIVSALFDRQRTGLGQHIDIAMAAVMASVNERAHLDLASGVDLNHEPPALGAQDIPFFETADGQCVALAASLVYSLTFPFYLQAMQRPDLADDHRFTTAQSRHEHRDELHAIVQDWVLSIPTTEKLEKILEREGIALGVVRSTREFASTIWAEEWGAFTPVPDRVGGEYLIPGPPWRFSRTKLAGSSGEPRYQGEDNVEILRDHGFSSEEIAQLQQTGAVLDGPQAGAPTHAPS